MTNQEKIEQKNKQVRKFIAQMWKLERDVKRLENAITKCKATDSVPAAYRLEGLLNSFHRGIKESHVRILRLCSLSEEVLRKREKEKDE